MKISYKIFLFTFLVISTSYSKVWNVGETRQYKYCSEISSLVADGDTIYIDSGTYQNDLQVTWSKNNLYISGLNGVPVIVAGDKIANDNSNGKGIFVIQGNNTHIENIEFRNSQVPDHNGAGIRQEGSDLYVSHCIFNSNEMGILQGGTIPNCTIKIEFCKFSNNGSLANQGYQHNIYINHIDSLIFQYNYTYDAIAQGHELKSRADNNFILYNKIANYTSEDSRNIDLPNGGTAVIMGNIIVQGPNSANTNIIGYGLEGNINKPPHNIWICNNTIVNNMNRGSFVDVQNADTLLMYNNICVGPKTAGFIIGNYKTIDTAYNFINDNIAAANFVSPTNYDYHLTSNSPAINTGITLNKSIKGHLLVPVFEYVDELSFKTRAIDEQIDIGAFEFSKTNEVSSINENQIEIYPNPATDYIIVGNEHIRSEQNIAIFDVFGNRVKAEEIYPTNQSHRINISTLSTGIYFLKIGNEKPLKFVKI